LADAAPAHDAVVLAAMPEELAPLRALLDDARPVVGGNFGVDIDIDIVTGRLGGNRVALAVTGDGDRNARLRAAAVLALAPARALLAIGVAGALSDDLVPGEVIAVTRVLRERGPLLAASPQLAAAAAGHGARAGVAVTADRIADTVAEKRRLLAIAAAGCVAADGSGDAATAAVVDLESAAYAEAAIEARIPWLILRAVSDTAAEALPALLNHARDAGGAVRRGRVVAGLLRDPSALPRLLGLRRRVSACAEALARGAARVIALSALNPQLR
jgi:adenosylhomocysteine nucleosidase